MDLHILNCKDLLVEVGPTILSIVIMIYTATPPAIVLLNVYQRHEDTHIALSVSIMQKSPY